MAQELASIIRKIVSPSSLTHSISHLHIGEFEHENKVETIIDKYKSDNWVSTGADKTCYLNIVEEIVRCANKWLDNNGAVIDPVDKTEYRQTSPRYVASGAVMLAFGRCLDLKDSIFTTMDWCCQRLANGEAVASDFWMRELVTAYMCLETIADQDHLARWKRDLCSVDPEHTYVAVKPDGKNLEELHNWTIYAAAGELMRERAGLASEEKDIIWGNSFFEKYMPSQLMHFTENGMYRDPHDPFTYDVTTRLQIATALAFGYDGFLQKDLDELLRRGALTQLLYMSPEGYVPFGGRSSQYHFQEAIISALCELEAKRYKNSNPRLAGAFKRQAHLSASSLSRWLDMKPFRHIKNGFNPDQSYGFDDYGKYSVYSLLSASFFGLAAIFADDEIEESPCPAEIGGYCFQLYPAFHKVFATCGGTQIEIDTQADFSYDATGLGRFCHINVPLELGLGMPITSQAVYTLPPSNQATQNLSIGPEWCTAGKWYRLANLSESLSSQFSVICEKQDHVSFELVYTDLNTKTVIKESYTLQEGTVRYNVEVNENGNPVDIIRLLVPIIVTDGLIHSSIKLLPGQLLVNYQGSTFMVSFDKTNSVALSATLEGNRNGLYKYLTLETQDHHIGVNLLLKEKVPSQ